MKMNHVLVDFENVQPKDLDLLKNGPYKVKLFVGPNQSKIPVTLASSLQQLGCNAEYVVMETAGNNALDFHIAYYIGSLSIESPAANFHIISRDSGFDSLIRHLRNRKISVQRWTAISEISSRTAPRSTISEERLKLVLHDLDRRKKSKPRTRKTLLNSINSLFKNELSEQQLTQVLSELIRQGFVQSDGTKVTYRMSLES